MNILLLAAGERPSETPDVSYPLWLSEVDGGLLIERQVRALSTLDEPRFVFMFRRADIEAYFLNDIVAQMTPDGVALGITHETAGAACTALLAAGAVDMDDELIVANVSDQIDVDFRDIVERFRDRGADAGVLTFRSLHPRYSYVSVDRDGWVVESAEKRPISRSANAGFYWFRKAADFFDALREMVFKDDHVRGRFYIAPALNQLILRHKKVAAIELGQDRYHPLKSERQIDIFETLLSDTEAQHATLPA